MTQGRKNKLSTNIVASGDHFTDRQDELGTLDMLADRVAMERHPYYAFVHGGTGVGKTTILDRFLKMQVSKRGSELHIFRITPSKGIDYPFNPFIRAVDSFVKENPNIPSKIMHITSALAGCIPGIGPDAGNILKAIESLRNPPGMEMYETDESITYSKYLKMIESISKNRMLIFCMDDAQWLDASSRMLLEAITSKNTNARILFVISARRPGDVKERTNLDALDRIRENAGERSIPIEIKPFTEEWYPELIKKLGNKCMTPERTHKIYENTNGNPYWLGQVLSGLIDEEQIPIKISTVLDSRLNEAYENVPKSRKALGYAAVLGSQFDLDTISGLVGMDKEEMFCMLGQLQERDLVKNPGNQDYFSLEHDITREHIYESLSAMRRDYHKNVAEFMKLNGGNSPDPYALAYHYSHAECNKEALRYMRIAARASEGLPLDSFERLKKCLEIAQELDMPKEEIASIKVDYARTLLDLKRAKSSASTTVLPARGLTHVHLGMEHVKDSMRVLEELISDECTPRHEKAISHVFMSRCHRIFETGESRSKSIKHAETAVSMLQDDEPKLLGDAYAYLATVYDHFDADETKTRHVFKEACKCYRGRQIELARLHRKAGMVMEARRAIEEMKKSLDVFKEHGMKLESARCFNNMGAECLYVGAFQNSIEFLRRSIDEFRAIGTHEIDIPLNNLGLCYLQDENYQKAMQYFMNALDMGQRAVQCSVREDERVHCIQEDGAPTRSDEDPKGIGRECSGFARADVARLLRVQPRHSPPGSWGMG